MSLRQETAERLCNCGPSIPPSGGPTQTMPVSVFSELLWKSVYSEGYYGNKKEFLEAFAELMNSTRISMPGIISQVGSQNDLPEIGQDNAIYILTDKKQLLFWQDGKGYVKITGSGTTGEVDADDIVEALDGKTVFIGGSAESTFE